MWLIDGGEGSVAPRRCETMAIGSFYLFRVTVLVIFLLASQPSRHAPRRAPQGDSHDREAFSTLEREPSGSAPVSVDPIFWAEPGPCVGAALIATLRFE